MIPACSLITCKSGKFSEVVERLQKINGVKRAFSVHGRWDVVAEIEVKELKDLSELVLKVNEVEGVLASDTLVGFEGL